MPCCCVRFRHYTRHTCDVRTGQDRTREEGDCDVVWCCVAGLMCVCVYFTPHPNPNLSSQNNHLIYLFHYILSSFVLLCC